VSPKNLSKMAVPVGVVAVILLMVVPIPAGLLDVLIAANITFAVVIVLIAMYVKRPLDFAVFPSLLLIATLFRLALNISATRLVLTDGYAGDVIHAFGTFVISGSLVIGLVIFLILIVIQFVVITNGAGRVAEVGARFTLDAMPGKQMAVDADLNAGLIDEETARTRRADIAAEADFYGAMDGSSKFVKGDAIAAIIITLINLIGGFIIGVVQKGLPISEAIHTYSLLTIGDGLVSQIPALLLSVATGLIVTRNTSKGDMASDMATQFGRQKRAVQIAGGAALALCLIPGMPKIPFLLIGGGVLLIAQRLPSAEVVEAAEEKAALPAGAAAAPAPDTPEAIMGEMRVDQLELMLSPDLVDLVDSGAGGDLLDRIRALRRKIALDLGLVLPPVRTRDSLDLPPSAYAVRIGGVEVARGEAPPGTVLAIGDSLEGLPGRAGKEPVFGLDGKWVPQELRHQAELAGATVVDRGSVIITHLSEIVRTHASRLLGREDVRALTEVLKRSHPVVVEELTPAMMSTGEIQRVLQALLDEGVSIRDLVRIFETLSLEAKGNPGLDTLVEACRAALGPAIAAQHSVDGTVSVLTLDPRLEQGLLESLRPADGGAHLLMDAESIEGLVGALHRMSESAEQRGLDPVLVCSPQLRAPLRRVVRLTVPRLSVLSYSEVSAATRIETIGVVSGADATAA
jgi:flagellar biosynthesis protein FlhA